MTFDGIFILLILQLNVLFFTNINIYPAFGRKTGIFIASIFIVCYKHIEIIWNIDKSFFNFEQFNIIPSLMSYRSDGIFQ